MKQDNRKRHLQKADYQTISLFVSLAILTLLLGFGLRWALFAPVQTPGNGVQAIEATK